jgi:hypothetical protein
MGPVSWILLGSFHLYRALIVEMMTVQEKHNDFVFFLFLFEDFEIKYINHWIKKSGIKIKQERENYDKEDNWNFVLYASVSNYVASCWITN